ncbi:MAG: small subunit ribosomal protein [Thermacetogenium sp.]|nr:small subunit ribosomal protein [Thermacetogenium sp.]
MQIEEVKKEFVENYWPEVYASRQNRTILTWPVIGVEVHSHNNGKIPCMVVGKDRIKGIIPLPESGVEPAASAALTRARLQSYIGQNVSFIVIGIDRENDLFMGSRAEALKVLQAELWPELKENAVKTATVRRIIRRPRNDGSVTELGAVVDLGGIEAFLPIYELSHGWVDDVLNLIQVGDVFDVKIIKVDREAKRVTVSLKDMIPDPWPDAARRYTKGGSYKGKVSGVVDYGVFINLEPGVDALCPHPKAGRVKKGDEVVMLVGKVSPEKRQIRGVIIRVLRRA